MVTVGPSMFVFTEPEISKLLHGIIDWETVVTVSVFAALSCVKVIRYDSP